VIAAIVRDILRLGKAWTSMIGLLLCLRLLLFAKSTKDGPLDCRLLRRFQLRVFFFAHFETDGFRAQWRRLHHVRASSLAITAETSSRA
jgi:hypothetical protein